MKYLSVVAASVLFGFVSAAPTALAEDSQDKAPSQQPHAAQPGMLNFLEGQATLGSQSLTSDSIGKVQVDPGQTLTTENGKAELLLTPGVLVRLGESSALTMISSTLTNTRMALEEGEAFVELDEVHSYNDMAISQEGVSIELLRMGLYNFNANLHLFRVLDGEAVVEDGERNLKVKSGEQVDLAARPLRAKKFDRKQVEAEDLYRWTSLRSSYLAEANVDYAPKYMYGGFGWFGDGWYWDPWFDAYTFLPGDGIFYSSFGWGFYSPWCVFGAPFFFSTHFHHQFGAPASMNASLWKGANSLMPMKHGGNTFYAARFKAHSSQGGGKGGGLFGGHGHVGGFRGAFHGGGFHGSGGVGGHR
jgi:uncharacterized membrane protein YgcG